MARTKKRAGPVQDERGVELVEFIGMMPILLWVGLIIWQFMVFGHCMLVTAAAARDGAREAAAYGDAQSAVDESIGDFYEYEVQAGSCGGIGSPVRVTVKAKVPIIEIPYVSEYIGDIETEHTATFRCEPRYQ